MKIPDYRRAVIVPMLILLSSCSRGTEAAPSPVYRIQSGNGLSLLTATDTHYLSASLTDNGPAFKRSLAVGDGKQLGYSDEIMEALGYDIQIQRPDVLIISGDLTNNGEEASHLDFANHLKAIEQASATQIYVIPGNHDIMNPWAGKFKGQRLYPADSVTPEEFSRIYNAFGYEEALTRDTDSLSYLAAPSDDLWLLMLDTIQYRNNKKLGHPRLDGRLTNSTLQWIRQCGKLASAHGAHIVAVMHHSLLDHSEFIQKGFTISDNHKVIDVLCQSGIKAAFSGHIHIQNIESSPVGGGTGIYDIAGSALSVYPHQYGVLKYSPLRQTLDYSTDKLNMEEWAQASGITDPNLLHFDHYSEESFRRLSSGRIYAQLLKDSDYADYTAAELQLMAEIAGRLSELYFAGTSYTGNAAIIASVGYRLWLDAPSGGLRSYVIGMAGRKLKDDQHLHVPLQDY